MMGDFTTNNHAADHHHNVQNRESLLMRNLKPVGNMLLAALFFFAATLGFNGCGDVNDVAGIPSTDANLANLTVNPGALQPAFSSDVTNYTANVDSSVISVTVTAQPRDAGATVSINGQTTTSRSVSPGAPGSSTPITIVVTAASGTQNTYLVTVNRAPLAGNINLQNLTVSPGTLVPGFLASTTSYTVDVANTVDSVTVTALPQDAGATVSINGQTGTSRSVSLGAEGSSTPILIEVTAPNLNQKTYLVLVNRAGLAGDNKLSALSVTGQTLVPAFSASVLNYTVTVASGVTSVNVSATKSDPNAVMSGSVTAGAGVATGQATISLNGPGNSTPITIVVEAPNGNEKTYTVIVNRAALGGNNNLQTLTVTSGSLVPAFIASTTSYTVAVASGVDSVTVAATAQDAGATVSINNQTTTSLLVPLGAAGSSTPISIEVTAPNGNPKTYTVTVNRAALGGNNNLQTLTVTSGSLVPAFIASTTSYTVAVASGVDSVTVAATAQDAGATVSINNQTTTSLLVPLGAAGSSTPISIEVTAPNGNPKTYTVTVNRAAIVLSGNNNLSALDVSAGALIETFDAGTPSYTVTAPNTTTDTTVTATVADPTATLTINGSAATSGVPSASIALAVGPNPIPIVVTAEDLSTKTYTVTITREP